MLVYWRVYLALIYRISHKTICVCIPIRSSKLQDVYRSAPGGDENEESYLEHGLVELIFPEKWEKKHGKQKCMKKHAYGFLMVFSLAPGSCVRFEYDLQFHRYHRPSKMVDPQIVWCDEAIQARSDAIKAEEVDLGPYNPNQGTSAIREVLRIYRTICSRRAEKVYYIIYGILLSSNHGD